MKYSKRVKSLLFEAYRRNRMAQADDYESRKSMTERWLGLGTEAAYRPVIEKGLMRFSYGETPKPRWMGWLVLTDSGVAALEELREEFEPVMERLESNPAYQGSYVANYMTVGGITS